MEHAAHEPAEGTAIHFGLLQILGLKIPSITNGGVAVAEMKLTRPGDDAFGKGIAAGDDHVVSAEIKLLNRQRHEREAMTVVFFAAGELLHEGGFYRLAIEKLTTLVVQSVDQAEKVGVRVDFEHLLKDAFSTAINGKPVVNDGDTAFGFQAGHGGDFWGEMMAGSTCGRCRPAI